MFLVINVIIIGLVIGLNIDECILKKNIVYIVKLSVRIDYGLFIFFINGDKN